MEASLCPPARTILLHQTLSSPVRVWLAKLVERGNTAICYNTLEAYGEAFQAQISCVLCVGTGLVLDVFVH